MITLTKIFHFEMAHAIYGYPGACKNIHGHSYELHVTVSGVNTDSGYIPAPGFVIDFKELKRAVTENIIKEFDHHIVLSTDYLKTNPSSGNLENLVIFDAEPTAENMLIYLCKKLKQFLPDHIKLSRLKLFETKDSYAEYDSQYADINHSL